MSDHSTNVTPDQLNYNHYTCETYNDDIRRSIPGHDQLHQAIIAAVQEFMVSHPINKILELGTGTGLTSEPLLQLAPGASLMAVDFSQQMLSGARRRLAQFQVDYICEDYAKLNFTPDYDIVLSVIGLHHQTDAGKQAMFQKIYEALKPGGIFIFGDLVTYQDPEQAALNEALHMHHLVENARDHTALQEWAHHHKFLNLLAPIEDQVTWLEQAGFSKVEIAFQHFNTALILANK